MTTPQQKQQAFEAAKKFGELFPGLLETLQEWASIGSIQQAMQDAQRKFADASAQMKLEMAELQTRRDRVKQVINDDRAQADEQAGRVRAQAELYAAQSLKAANDAAEKIKSDAEAAVVDHVQKVAAAQAALKDLETRRTAAAADIEAGKRDRATVAEYEKRVGDALEALQRLEARSRAAAAELAKSDAALAEKQAALNQVDAALELAAQFTRRK